MNRAQFTEFMKSPSALSNESTQLLGQVLKEFPYCQTAQLLYVKSLHLHNSIHYNNQLKIAAAYATDRSMLHALITRKAPGTEQKHQHSIPENPPVVSRNDAQIVSSLERNQATQAPAEKPELKQPSPQEVLEARLKELEELNRQAEAALQQKSALLAAEAPLPSLMEAAEIPVAAQPESVKNDSLPVRKASPVPEPDNLTDPVHTDDTQKTVRDLETLSGTYLSAAIDATIQIEIEQEEAGLPIQEEEEEEAAPEEDDDSELSFTDWLKKSKVAAEGKGKPAETQGPEEEEKKHKETALIERFIKEEPRITKPKKEFYSPVNMARQSVVEDLSFVTETLAGIYAKQGNVAKAIRAYQTLSLKYPEKKLYFASLIEKLEQGI
jgi:hypothetical protein